MSFQNDAFDLEFDTLYETYPDRHVPVYRYKVVNFDDTLNRVLIKPRRSVLLQLEDETFIQAVQDTYQGQKTTITINSNQSAGSAEGFVNETITLITNNLIPSDYRNNFYIYSLTPIPKEQLSSTDLFLDQIGASTFPDLQVPFFENSKNKLQKVTNVLILTKLKLNTTGTNTNIYSYKDEEIEYFDANKNIILRMPGPINDFGVSFYDEQNHKRQLEYNLVEDNTHLYGTLQMQPTKIRPDLTFSSDTYDKNKNVNFERVKRYIGQFASITELWQEFGIRTTDPNNAEGKLYSAFLTIVWLSNQRLTKFKEYIITDKNNPNNGKIDISEIDKVLYGVTAANILSLEQKEFNALILKTWEQEFSKDLDTRPEIQAIYQELKSVLSALGEYIPSPYAYGNYQKIGRLALEWYFVPEKMNLTIKEVEDKVPFNVRLESEKYVFDELKKNIKGLKPEFLKISGVRTFNLDGQITLPTVPETLTEENKDSTAGSVDVTNISFLNYTWIFQILDNSKYKQLFFTDNPFALKSEITTTKTLPFQKNKDVLDKGAGTFTDAVVENYISENFILADRQIVNGSAKVVVTLKREITDHVPNEPINGRPVPGKRPVFSNFYKFVFTWREKPTEKATVTPISPPFSINQAAWELFESALGISVCEYICKPIINIGTGITQRRISDIQWKSTLGNYAEIDISAKLKNNAGSKIVTFRIDQAFKRDQTITQEGILI